MSQRPQIIRGSKQRDVSPSNISSYTAKAYKTFDNQAKKPNVNNSTTDRLSVASKKTCQSQIKKRAPKRGSMVIDISGKFMGLNKKKDDIMESVRE